MDNVTDATLRQIKRGFEEMRLHFDVDWLLRDTERKEAQREEAQREEAKQEEAQRDEVQRDEAQREVYRLHTDNSTVVPYPCPLRHALI